MEDRIKELEEINIDLQEANKNLEEDIERLQDELADAEDENEMLQNKIEALEEDFGDEYHTLTDQMKYEYFKEHFNKITQEQLENIVNK